MKNKLFIAVGLAFILLAPLIGNSASLSKPVGPAQSSGPVTIPGTAITIVPLPGWQVDASQQGYLMVITKMKKKFGENSPPDIHIYTVELKGTSPEIFLTNYANNLRNQKGFQLVDQHTMKIGDADFNGFEFYTTAPQASLAFLVAIHIQDGKAWVFQGASGPATAKVNLPEFRQMFTSIRFPPPTQQPPPTVSQPAPPPVTPVIKPDKPLQVVVYNLEAQGVGGSIADIMTSAIVTELSSSEYLTVRDEKTTIAVLKERGIAQTDYCDAEKCRIDTAKLIKADRIVLGNIGKLEEKVYVITVRVADVNGTTIYPQRNVCSDCSTTQILSVIDTMAKNIRVFLETGQKP